MTIYFNGYEEKLFQQIKSKYTLTDDEIERYDCYMDNYQPIQKSVVTPRDALLLEQAQEEMSFKRNGGISGTGISSKSISTSGSLSARSQYLRQTPSAPYQRASECISTKTSSKKQVAFMPQIKGHTSEKVSHTVNTRERSYTSAMYEGTGHEELKKEKFVKAAKAVIFYKAKLSTSHPSSADKKKCVIC